MNDRELLEKIQRLIEIKEKDLIKKSEEYQHLSEISSFLNPDGEQLCSKLKDEMEKLEAFVSHLKELKERYESIIFNQLRPLLNEKDKLEKKKEEYQGDPEVAGLIVKEISGLERIEAELYKEISEIRKDKKILEIIKNIEPDLLKDEAEQLISVTEKAIKDLGDKVKEEEKKEIKTLIDETKEALKGNDIKEIKTKIDQLSEKTSALSARVNEEMNKQAQKEKNPLWRRIVSLILTLAAAGGVVSLAAAFKKNSDVTKGSTGSLPNDKEEEEIEEDKIIKLRYGTYGEDELNKITDNVLANIDKQALEEVFPNCSDEEIRKEIGDMVCLLNGQLPKNGINTSCETAINGVMSNLTLLSTKSGIDDIPFSLFCGETDLFGGFIKRYDEFLANMKKTASEGNYDEFKKIVEDCGVALYNDFVLHGETNEYNYPLFGNLQIVATIVKASNIERVYREVSQKHGFTVCVNCCYDYNTGEKRLIPFSEILGAILRGEENDATLGFKKGTVLSVEYRRNAVEDLKAKLQQPTELNASLEVQIQECLNSLNALDPYGERLVLKL